MSESSSSADQPDDEEAVDWEETDLWDGIQDAKDDEIVRPEYEFEF